MNNLSVRLRIFLSLFFIALITSIIFSYNLYSSQKELYFSSIQKQLKTGANSIILSLGNDYVDKYTLQTPIDKAKHLANLTKLGTYAEQVGLEYIYIMTKVNKKVYIHISSAPKEEIKEEEYDTFMTEYECER